MEAAKGPGFSVAVIIEAFLRQVGGLGLRDQKP